MYSTVPEIALPGFVSTWFILVPEPFNAPVIPPVTVPTVQVNVLGTLAVRLILGLLPLHIRAVEEVVTIGEGSTVTSRVKGCPVQDFVEEYGVMIYCTTPGSVVPGLVRTWLITLPEPPSTPVIPEGFAPMVQEKLLDMEAERLMFAFSPLQMLKVFELVIVGDGKTVTVIENGSPWQAPAIEVGMTLYSIVPVE